MKDAYQVLRQKESDIHRIRREIDALRSVIPMLAETVDPDTGESRSAIPEARNPSPQETSISGTEGEGAQADASEARFWSFGRKSR